MQDLKKKTTESEIILDRFKCRRHFFCKNVTSTPIIQDVEKENHQSRSQAK